jgi:hypothetical protein
MHAAAPAAAAAGDESAAHPQQQQRQQQQTFIRQATQPDEQRHVHLMAQLLPLSYTELQQLQRDAFSSSSGGQQHPAFSASFLFWLAAQEKAAHGSRQQVGAPRGRVCGSHAFLLSCECECVRV